MLNLSREDLAFTPIQVEELSFFTEKGEFNPAFMGPAGGAVFNGGKTFTNSGIMMGGQSYTLKFTKAGTYTHECYLHSGSKRRDVSVPQP